MQNHLSTGATGENLAVKYLEVRDFTIMERNWRFSHWEIDIIASRERVLHFIEVKTRRTKTFGYPEEDVTRKKMLHLIDASEEYQFQHPEWTQIQFDILAINLYKTKPPEYFFIEDVYI